MLVRRADARDVDGCVEVLRQLPDYFTPDTHEKVAAALPHEAAWVGCEGDVVIGFVLLEHRYAHGAEITWAAVFREHQANGVGTALVTAAVEHARSLGVRAIEVKTLDAAAGYEPYVATRAFWEHRGFVQVDCIDPLPDWQPGNPAAIYVLPVTG